MTKFKDIIFTVLFFGFSVSSFCYASKENSQRMETEENKRIEQELINQLNGAQDSFGFTRVTENNIPKLYAIVKNLTEKLGNPMPKIFVFKGNLVSSILNQFGLDLTCNAFAASLTKSISIIFVGRDLIDNMTESELEAVIAHELGHIDKYHTLKKIVSITILGLVVKLLVTNCFPEGDRMWVGVCAGSRNVKPGPNNLVVQFIEFYTVAYIVKKLVEGFILRCHEKEADLLAASIINDPISLAKALECLEKTSSNKDRFIMDSIMELISTHPLTKHRKTYLKDFAAKKSC